MSTTETTQGRATTSTMLGEEFAFFARHINARIEAGAVLVALVARVFAGSWGYGDAIIVAVILGVQPFFEWVFHVYVLHYRPITVLGRTFDFELARKHREHHEDPTDVGLIFVPLRSLVIVMATSGALMLLLFPTMQGALTALAATGMLLLAYEWTHYLIHSRYRPKSRFFRYLWRAHRLHHYKNEQYWFGVTNPAADHVLRTFPAPNEVETSPTARNLNARA